MKKILKSTLLFMAIASGTGFMTGCSDDDLPAADALFRPVLSDDNITHGLTEDNVPYMIIEWDNYSTANKYVVTIAANDGSDERSIETDKLTCRFDGLQYDREYNITIHSENTTNGMSSKDFVMTTTTLDFPTSLSSVQSSDIIDTQARIKWSGSEDVVNIDSIAVYHDSKDSLVAGIKLTEDELASREIIVRNLDPKTGYRVEAYLNDSYKGKKRFTTAASENYTGNVVDLRGYNAEDSYKLFSQAFVDSILSEELYKDQDLTIVLQGGVQYRLPTLTIPATNGILTFTTGLSLAGRATFDVTGNFTVAAGSEVKGFVFDKLDFSASTKPTDNNFGGKYLFNIGNSGAKIGAIDLKDCNVKWKRGVIRIQTAASIESVSIDQCMFDSIAGYGIVNADNAAAEINNIKVTNSTFSTCQVMFTNTKGLEPKSVSVENCTFYHCGTTKKFIFDFKGKNVVPTVKNCLFGPAYDNSNAWNGGLEAWSGDVKPNADGNFFTSDLIWRVKSEEDPTPKAQLDGTTLPTDVAGTFKDADNDDFTIITKDLGGSKPTPGDPRWY